jgi:hypothetical protein
LRGILAAGLALLFELAAAVFSQSAVRLVHAVRKTSARTRRIYAGCRAFNYSLSVARGVFLALNQHREAWLENG